MSDRPLLAEGAPRPDLPEGTGKQFIQGSYDCITFLGELTDTLPHVLVGNRNNFERM